MRPLFGSPRAAGFSEPTIAAFVAWVCRYILFHGKHHPRDLGLPVVRAFLELVVTTEKDPLPALDAARRALEFLYGSVLHQPLEELPRPRPPRLLDQVRQILRVRHYARRTEECCVQWITHFILHQGKRHPRDRGAAEVEPFLTHLAVEAHVSASTQNQALAALLFLYDGVLDLTSPLDLLEDATPEVIRAALGARESELVPA